MQVLLLGPVTVVDAGRTTVLRSARQAALLAALALRAGRPVGFADLVDTVFGEDPPPTSRNTLQVHVSALRRLLGPVVVEAVGAGYRLRDDDVEVDVLRFADLVEQGLLAQRRGRHVEAARLLRTALSLWRGRPFEGVDSPGLRPERERLLSLRLVALLTRVDADLALGRHLLLVTELQELAAEHPYDEGVAARLMIALYRSGRQSDALGVHAAMRERLRTDLGVDPGPDLRRTHRLVLRHDSGLGRPEEPAREPSPAWQPALLSPTGGLLGRDAALADLEARLGEARLHTLVGPSGVGKSRLAAELAARCQGRFTQGAVVVDATALSGPDDLARRVVEALGDTRAATLEPDERQRVVQHLEGLVVLDDLRPCPDNGGWLGGLVASGRATWVVTAPRPLGLAGERIVQLPPLECRSADGAPGPAADLLLARARAAGAVVPDDQETRHRAAHCAELLDGNALAIELAARLAVAGLPELARTIERRLAAGRRPEDAVTLSFASSLALLDAAELDLLDVLSVASGPLDAETLAACGPEAALAALVRDGLVRRTPGSHGHALFDVRPLLAYHRAGDREPEVTRRAEVRLLRALIEAVGPNPRYLPMQIRSEEHARRLVALEPALAGAPALARDVGLVAEIVPVALLLCELHFSRFGVARPLGRDAWLLDHAEIGPDRRVDLLLAEAVDHVNQDDPAGAVPLFAEAVAMARALDDPARVAVALGQLSVGQLLTGADLGVDDDLRREAVALAERSECLQVLAGTLLLLYPAPDAPPDLADVLPRAVRAARESGHTGLLVLALVNLAAWRLDRGEVAEALVLAQEGAVLAQRMHNRGSLLAHRSVVETASALLGTDEGLAHLSAYLRAAWDDRGLRACADALLWMAAGLRRRRGDDAAARCLGVYRAMLVRFGAATNQAESTFLRRWLDGVAADLPHEDLDAAVEALVAEWGGDGGSPAGTPSAPGARRPAAASLS